MIISGAFDNADILKRMADISWKRNEIINNNIANVDTPGYKREDLRFASMLEEEIEANRFLTTESRKDIKELVTEQIDYFVYKDYSGMSYRLDGNNVDIDTENAELASNQLLYNGIVDSMSAEFSRISTAIGR